MKETNKFNNEVIKSWLQKEITVEEAENKNSVLDHHLGEQPVPFGFINQQWELLKSKLTDEDELWEFESPPCTWEKLCGRKGLAVVRKGKVIDIIVTRMN